MTLDEAGPARRAVDLPRVAGVAAYVVALGVFIHLFGLPKQSVVLVVWIWLATVAWDVRRPPREHLVFLRDWWPPMAVLVFYLYSRGLSDDLGIFKLHETEPISVDRWLFGGTLPTEYLQAHLCGTPCVKSLPPRWYDVILTTVYYSHFFASLIIAGWLWKRHREEWLWFMRRYLTVLVVTVCIYVVYPMAPPWMAARDGYISHDVSRITGRGWFDLGSSSHATLHQSVSAVGNQVAAMPSLHAGLTMLIAWWGIRRMRTRWRWVLLLYPVAMSFTLVYYAEHYVVDTLAAAVMVAAVMAGCALWDRWRHPGHALAAEDAAEATDQSFSTT